MVLGLVKSHNLKKELLCLRMLQYNSCMWKNKCNDNYKQYRFMVDNQEFFLWRNYGVRTVLTDKKELEMKINHLGKIFHNPQQKYHLQNNGQILFSSGFSRDFIKIGEGVLEKGNSKYIQFPTLDINKKFSYCSAPLENINYLHDLMHFLKIF